MKIYTRCVYAWRPDGSPVLEESDSFEYEGPVILAKSSPSPPPAPDYAAAAREQGAANTETARVQGRMNNPNVINPYGSQNVTWGGGHQAEYDAAKAAFAAGTGGDPGTIEQFNTNFPNADQATITQTLNPQSQATFNQQQQVQLALAQLANQGVGNVGNVLGTGFHYQGPGIQTSLANPGALQTQLANPGALQTQLANAGNLQSQVANAGQIQAGPQASSYGLAEGGVNAPSLQMQLDRSGIAQMPVNAGMTAQNAIMSRLSPQIERERNQLETQLRNQGLVAGGEAYGNAATIQNQRENDLLAQAALQGVNLDLAANQQGFTQAVQSGQFGNEAQLASFGAGLQNQQARNQAIGQNFGQALAAAQLQNAQQNQLYGQNLSNANFANSAVGQRFGQNLAEGQFANSAVGQQYNQNLGAGQFANSAIGQQYNQNLGAAQFANTAQQQGYGQQLTERNLPLNEISALMSGSQIQNPQFQQYQGAQVAPAPIFNAAQAQQQYNQGMYGLGVGQANSFNSGLMSMGGAIGAAFI